MGFNPWKRSMEEKAVQAAKQPYKKGHPCTANGGRPQ
jgi:hypothetical protein